MLPVAAENTRVNGKVAIWLFQAQLGKLATSRLHVIYRQARLLPLLLDTSVLQQ
jgi:hypothetical protein